MRERSEGRLARVVALAVIATAAACGAHQRPGGAEVTEPAVLEVENNNWQDAKIYLTGVGPRVRLGTVTAQGTERFRIPAIYLHASGVRLEVSLLASSEQKVTDRFLVSPGDAVELTVQNQLSLSSYAVYPH